MGRTVNILVHSLYKYEVNICQVFCLKLILGVNEGHKFCSDSFRRLLSESPHLLTWSKLLCLLFFFLSLFYNLFMVLVNYGFYDCYIYYQFELGLYICFYCLYISLYTLPISHLFYHLKKIKHQILNFFFNILFRSESLPSIVQVTYWQRNEQVDLKIPTL